MRKAKETTIKKQTKVNEEIIVKKTPQRILPEEVYTYRYFINTNIGGTLFFTDLKKPKFIEFDEKQFPTVHKLSLDECEMSSSLNNFIKLGQLKEVTADYICYLEKKQENNKLIFNASRGTIVNPENKDFVVVEQRKEQKLLPTLEELSNVDNTSDEMAHKRRINENLYRTDNLEDRVAIERILSNEDRDSASILNPDIYADKSNPNPVDPRMFIKPKKETPTGPREVAMRDKNDPFSILESVQNQNRPSNLIKDTIVKNDSEKSEIAEKMFM